MSRRVRLTDSGQSIAKGELGRRYYKLKDFAVRHNLLLSNVTDIVDGNFVSEKVFNKTFKLLNIKLNPISDLEFCNNKITKDKSETEAKVERSIELPPEYREAGTSILIYFNHIIRVKYPDKRTKVRIEQDGITLRMIISTPNGCREVIEKTLSEYGMVVTGKLEPEDFLSDPLEVMALKNKLEIANLELRQSRQLLSFAQNNNSQNQKRIESLESQVSKLYYIIELGLLSGNNALEAIEKTTGKQNIHITQGNYNEQKGNFGIGHMSNSKIQEGAKIFGVMNKDKKLNSAEAAEENTETTPTNRTS